MGVADLDDFGQRIAVRTRAQKDAGQACVVRHPTRNRPKRHEELLAGGSLYWIVSGFICARMKFIDIEDAASAKGAGCVFVLEPTLIRTVPRPHRPFQGWRYLEPGDAPPDIQRNGNGDLPVVLVNELRQLGLI